MKHKTHILLVLTLFAVLCSSIQAKDTWVKVNSKNFELIGNAGEKDIRRVATKLEQFREVFSRVFGKDKLSSPIPTTVIVFKSQDSFTPYKPLDIKGKAREWVGGYFLPGDDSNFITITAEGDEDVTYQAIYHEYIHFLVSNSLGKSSTPPWFNEGIAGFYETFKMEEDKRAVLGSLHPRYLSLIKQNDLIPLETFFKMDHYTLAQQGADGAGIFYAQAWGFMHYLLRGNDGARQPQLAKFLSLIMSGKSAKESFAIAFQTDFASIEKELRKYLDSQLFKSYVVTFDNKLLFDNEIFSERLSEARAKTYLGNLLTHLGRTREASAHLEEALALEPNLGIAQAVYGILCLKQGKLQQANNYLEMALANEPNSYRTNYLYAYVLSRKGMTDYGFVSGYEAAHAEKIYSALLKSIKLNPDFIKSYELYAFVSSVRNENVDQAIDYMMQALKIASGNEWLQIRLAELYLRKERFIEARKYAQSVSRNASTPAVRLYAQTTIQRIDSTEAQLESIKNNKNRLPAGIVTDTPKSEEEIAKLREKATLESLNQNIRKPNKDEKQILGNIIKVDCSGGAIYFLVRSESGIATLQTNSFQSINLTAYNVSMERASIGCGKDVAKQTSVITYKVSKNPRSKIAGEIVSIEFVPPGFKLAK